MSNANQKFFREAAEITGLEIDDQTGYLFGIKNGYSVIMEQLNQSKQFNVSVSVCRGTELPNAKEMKHASKLCKQLLGCTVQRYKVTYAIRSAMSGQKSLQNLADALDFLTQFLSENGYENCCQNCGAAGETKAYLIGGISQLLCPACFTEFSNAADSRRQSENVKKENVVSGTVGAFLGSLLGAAAILLIAQLGYVSALGGIIISVCALKGYELLGGKLSKKGMVISSVLILLLVFLANQADWAIFVARYVGVDVFTAFSAIPELLSEEYLDAATYYGNLVMLYLFSLLGAVPTIIGTVRGEKLKNVTCKMTSESGSYLAE